MKTIQLYGPLAAQFGPTHRIEVASAQEALRALSVREKPFLDALHGTDCVLVRLNTGGERMSEEQIETALDHTELHIGPDLLTLGLGQADLHIVSFVHGESGKGIGKVLVGVALVAGAWITPIAAGAAASTALTGTAASAFGMSISYGQIALIGATLALSGVSQLMASTPSSSQSSNNTSFTIDGQANIVGQGTPVALIYGGPVRVGSVSISQSITTGGVSANGGVVKGGTSGQIAGGGGGIIGISYTDHSLIQAAE